MEAGVSACDLTRVADGFGRRFQGVSSLPSASKVAARLSSKMAGLESEAGMSVEFADAAYHRAQPGQPARKAVTL